MDVLRDHRFDFLLKLDLAAFLSSRGIRCGLNEIIVLLESKVDSLFELWLVHHMLRSIRIFNLKVT